MTSAPSEAANGGDTNQRYRRKLRNILSGNERPVRDQIQQVLQLGAERFGVELGMLVQVDAAGETYTVDEVNAPHPDITRGFTGDLLSTYCRMVMAEEEPLAIENALEQGWGKDPAYQSSLLSTYIGTEVHVGSAPYGTICFIDLNPRDAAFDDEDHSFLVTLSQATEELLERRESTKAPPAEHSSQELSGVERRYRTALKHSPVLFAKIDDELRYEWRFSPQPDVDSADVVGKRDDEIHSGAGIDQLVDLKQRALDSGEQIREEIVFEDTDGLSVYDITATPLREGEGDEVTGLITAALNVTQRKDSERRLGESEARYRALAENFPSGAVGVYDRDLRYTLVRGTLVGDVLPSASDFEGHRVTDVFPEETASDIVPLFRRAVEEGELGSVETQFDGRHWKVWAAPLRDKNGEIFAGLSFAQDVTGQHRREQELRVFRQAVEQANDAILITEASPLDEPGPRIEYVNSALEEMTGYDADELLGRTPRLLQGKETDPAVLDSLREALENGEPWEGETINYRKDQTPYRLRWSVAPVRDEEGDIKRWMSIQRNVTEERKREHKLHRQRNLLNQTQRLAGAWEVDLRTEAVNWSESLYEIHEVPPDTEITLDDALDYFHEEDRAELERAFDRCVEEGDPYDLELRLITAKGNERWVRTVGAPAETDTGTVVKVAGAFQDITDRKEAERRRKQVIRRVTDAIVEVDADWRFTLVNDQAEALYDMQEEELLGKNFWDVFRGALDTRFEETYRRVMQTREPGSLVEHYPDLGGWFDIKAYPNDDGGVAFYFQEVTKQKQQEARLRDLSNSIPGVVFQFYARPDGTYGNYFVSEHAKDVLGIPPEPETFHERAVERIPDSHREAFRASIREAIEEEIPWEFEAPFVKPSGERRWILGRSIPRKRDGEMVFNGVLFDITERKKAEQAHNRMAEAMEVASDGMALLDEEGTYTYMNQSHAEIFGYDSPDAFLGNSWRMCYAEMQVERFEEEFMPTLHEEGTWQGEVLGKRKDGTRFPQHVTLTQLEDGGLICVTRDVTERKKAERELRRSERRFRKIFENAAIGIAIGNEGRFQRANPAFQSMLGYEEAELQGRHFSDVTHPDDVEPIQVLFDELIEGKRDRFQIEQRYVRKDGELFWGRLTVSLLDLDDGQKHVALVEDIDEQKHYESKLREAKNAAEEAARLKTVMLANMSHEVRTPLTSMIGFSGILEDQLQGKSAKLVRLIRKSGQRLEETMEAVLELSQLEAGSYTLDQEPLRLDSLVKRHIDAFELQAEKSGVTLALETGDDPVDVFADETAVRRVMSNLLDNALKFTPEGGQVTVRTRVDGPKTVILEVEDTGVGISEEALPTVFEAFKQESEGLTREYEGAGLGLSIVQQLVEALGGQIDVDTAKGEGTRVTVHLPRTSGDGSSPGSE